MKNEKMTVNKAVALRVSEFLIQNKMTQYRLAQKSDISTSRLDCIMREKNKTVTLSTVMLLAKGFDITLLKFLDSPYFTNERLEVE